MKTLRIKKNNHTQSIADYAVDAILDDDGDSRGELERLRFYVNRTASALGRLLEMAVSTGKLTQDEFLQVLDVDSWKKPEFVESEP